MSSSSTGSSEARRFLGVTLLITVMLGAAAELWLRFGAPQRDVVVAALEAARNTDMPGIVLGDSHTFALGNRIEGYANLSIPGANLPMMRALTEIRLQHAAPHLAIVAAGAELFSASSVGRGDGGLVEAIDAPPLRLATPPMTRRLIPSLLRKTGGAEAEMTSLGVGERWDQVPADKRKRWTRARVEQQAPVGSAERQTALEQFQALVARLQQAGVSTCLVRMPVTEQYLQDAARHPTYAELDAELRALADNAQLPWVDFRDLSPPLTMDEFLNQDHLNTAGAARFAPWLRQRCRQEELH
jgi:hypothetical protein